MRAVHENGGLLILESESPVLFYRSDALDPRNAPWRRHYVHPLYAPDGTELTEDSPSDHIHHRGCFWGWRRILVKGRVVADSWVMRNLTYRPQSLQLSHEEKIGVLRICVDWRFTGDGPERVLFTEESTIRIRPLTHQRQRRVDFDISLIARQPHMTIAGSDDDKGYGGFSLRLLRSEDLTFTTNGKTVEPKPGPVSTDGPVAFAWQGPGPSAVVTVHCAANGVIQRNWILRRGGMQNCVFPGLTPFGIDEGRKLSLSAHVLITPTN